MICLEEPPFSTVELRKPREFGSSSGLRAHAQLAEPTWIATNLAYLTDLDVMATKTDLARRPRRPSPKWGGKRANEEEK